MIMVYDIDKGEMIEVSQAEAAAGLLRFGRRLGSGSAAGGIWEQRAIELAKAAK